MTKSKMMSKQTTTFLSELIQLYHFQKSLMSAKLWNDIILFSYLNEYLIGYVISFHQKNMKLQCSFFKFLLNL